MSLDALKRVRGTLQGLPLHKTEQQRAKQAGSELSCEEREIGERMPSFPAVQGNAGETHFSPAVPRILRQISTTLEWKEIKKRVDKKYCRAVKGHCYY